MTESRWRRQARNVIRRVLAELPADASEADKRRAVSAAYPFWERAHHPYKMWLAEVKAQLGGRVRKKIESDMVTARLVVKRMPATESDYAVRVDCGWCGNQAGGCLGCRNAWGQVNKFAVWDEWTTWQRAMSENATAALACSDWLEENGWGDLAAQLRAMSKEAKGC
jgi:hypothetical protein